MSLRVKAAEIQKNFGKFQDRALMEPVTVTKYGRDSVVILSVAEYRKLRQCYREALAVESFSDAEIDAIARAEMSPEHSALDEELS